MSLRFLMKCENFVVEQCFTMVKEEKIFNASVICMNHPTNSGKDRASPHHVPCFNLKGYMTNNIGAEVKMTFDMQIHMELFTHLHSLTGNMGFAFILSLQNICFIKPAMYLLYSHHQPSLQSTTNPKKYIPLHY